MLHRLDAITQGAPAQLVWDVRGLAATDVSAATVEVYCGADQTPAATLTASVVPDAYGGLTATCALGGSDTAFFQSGRLTARLALQIPGGTRTQDLTVPLWPSTLAAPSGATPTPMEGRGAGFSQSVTLRLSAPLRVSRSDVRISQMVISP